MQIDIITIGNSKGLRLPKALIAQCGFEDSVEVHISNGALILRKPHIPREGWDAAFATETKKSEAALSPDMSFPNDFDDKEWTW